MVALWSNIILFGWMVIVFLLFRRLPTHRAVIIAFLLGCLFLPEVHTPRNNPEVPTPLSLPGLKVTKSAITCLAPLLAALLFDFRRIAAFRPRWFDLPVFLWALSPLMSAYTNEPPPDGSSWFKDGFASTRLHLVEWAGPYFLARIYFSEIARFRELVIGFILAGLLYVPLCLFEVRFSPQLHKWIYGFYQHDFSQAIRGGGYRPTVFLEHGLTVAIWMCAVTVIAFWSWWSGAVSQIDRGPGKRPIPMTWVVVLLVVTTVALKSAGALVLGVGATAVLVLTRFRVLAPLAVAGFLAVGPLYSFGRIAVSEPQVGWLQIKDWYNEDDVQEHERLALQKRMFGWAPWTSREALDVLGDLFSPDRAASLGFRLVNEDKLMERGAARFWFGWAGWGRARIYNEEGEDMTVTDGFWIITLGDRGIVGLITLFALILLPAVRYLWHHPARTWGEAAVAPGAAVAITLGMYMLDNMTNAQYNPLFMVMAGALAGVAGARATPRDAAPPPTAALPATLRRPTPRPVEARPGVLSRPRPQ